MKDYNNYLLITKNESIIEPRLLTRGHKTLERSGYLSFGSRIKVCYTLIVKYIRIPQRFIPPSVVLH